MTVRISRSLIDRIIALAGESRDEVCGLLLGVPDHVQTIGPAANVAPDPSRHFEIDPAVLIAAHRDARRGGPAVIGHYHSHPSGIAKPSATDTACAAPDGALWIIVGGGLARCWRAASDGSGGVHFDEAPIRIE
ncbi:proteasome lid subunit RPN8/RPN11 [Sphingobium fontiphilum]|uniref:Proteasome lid subunit RPN8/RPN11 n=1 Tax=Sphingobium fontiphilum TaxID=944425 RepID=A0A7W6DDE4_9SPHN|nr:M67 family metallopeptidase [Sphingobium fontiphilum]MBB3981190.1 proteasome lid subunit RPN8/RPN11 [Sphingobium fontiphilum]